MAPGPRAGTLVFLLGIVCPLVLYSVCPMVIVCKSLSPKDQRTSETKGSFGPLAQLCHFVSLVSFCLTSIGRSAELGFCSANWLFLLMLVKSSHSLGHLLSNGRA